MSGHLTDTDLSALFGIDLDTGADPVAKADVTAILCGKCNGRGNFVGYTGRIVGKCFACAGTGLAPAAGVTLQPGDCVKCAGSGAYSPGRPCFACNGTGKEQAPEAITITAIVDAFAAARTNGIKSPKLRLDAFIFSRAPDAGKNAGAIYVKSKDGEYLGKVAEGQFRPTMACDAPMTARVIEVAADPHKAAKAYGAKTGECSCCGRELTNAESVELGIGPICRDKYGW